MPLYNLDRAATVSRFLKLEVNRRDELQQIVRLAADVCDTPLALITLLDEHMQYIRFQAGSEQPDAALNNEIFQLTISCDTIFEIKDAQQDAHFRDKGLVTGDSNIRFYAGAPLATRDGYMLGCLSVMDRNPRLLSDNQKKMLLTLSGQIIQIIEFDISINLLKDQVEQLQLSEIKLKSFFESTVSCHLLIGKEFEVLAFNKIVAGFVKDNLDIVIKEKMPVTAFLHDNYQEEFILNCGAAMKGENVTSEKELTYQDGHSVYWYMSFEPALGKHNDIIGVSFNATDITERIRQEQLVLKQNQALRQIAFVQSHELRRPVSSILGIIELIRSEETTTDMKEEIMMLDQAAKELDGKIREVISFTN